MEKKMELKMMTMMMMRRRRGGSRRRGSGTGSRDEHTANNVAANMFEYEWNLARPSPFRQAWRLDSCAQCAGRP